MGGSSSSGAKGVASFETGLKRGYLPHESSIQHEGIIYDYYFETANEEEKLFKANYALSISKDPLNGRKEYYIGVGLASKLDGGGLKKHGGRPPLNLVIVLDISGSMGSTFGESQDSLNKLEVAKQSLFTLIGRLNQKDKFGIVIFDTIAEVFFPLTEFGFVNQAELKEKINKLQPRGGTNIEKGLECASNQYSAILSSLEKDPNSNRIIFLTDATPNGGDTTAIINITKENASKKIYSTFIGIGIDFNTNLVSQLSNIRGSNYFSVKSSREFKKQMEDEFDYMVTVSTFNIAIDFASSEWVPERVYGSPGFEIPQQGRLLFIDSSFPTSKEGSNMTKGGIVLVKMKRQNTNSNAPLEFRVQYEDTEGNKFNDVDTVTFPNIEEEEMHTNLSIRKAVLLMRFVNLMKTVLRDQRLKKKSSITMQSGIEIPPLDKPEEISEESEASNDVVDPSYSEVLKAFSKHLENEIEIIGDKRLEKELESLNQIISIVK